MGGGGGGGALSFFSIHSREGEGGGGGGGGGGGIRVFHFEYFGISLVTQFLIVTFMCGSMFRNMNRSKKFCKGL